LEKRVLEYIRLRPGRGFKPIRASLYYAQRIVVHEGLRTVIIACIVKVINLLQPRREWSQDENFPSAGRSGTTVSLKTSGIVPFPSLLPEHITEINEYLSDKPLVLRDGKQCQRDLLPPGTTIGDYPLETVLRCPHVMEIANTRENIQIVSEYLGCLPTISTIGIRWSLPGSQQQATTQNFHRDFEDWRFLKFFAYLTDVDLDCGPHLFVRGSHRGAGSMFFRPIEVEYIRKTFGDDAIEQVSGPRGTAFMADTRGIHAGPIPKRRARLMLEVGYSILPNFALKYSPLKFSPHPPVNKYINRLLLE
jgi:hypothetical protein